MEAQVFETKLEKFLCNNPSHKLIHVWVTRLPGYVYRPVMEGMGLTPQQGRKELFLLFLWFCKIILPDQNFQFYWHSTLGQSQWEFHGCFLHETLRREKERVSPWWNLWAQFHMRWKLCETPIKTQIEFHHATMQLNHPMREKLWDPLSLWNCAMKLCNETMQWNYALRETSISYQSFTSWKPGRWNSPLRLDLVLLPHFVSSQPHSSSCACLTGQFETKRVFGSRWLEVTRLILVTMRG
jgi:hypothetical protein